MALDRAHTCTVSPAEAVKIRRKVRENMKTFLGHRELPLNETTVYSINIAWIKRVLTDPDRYGPALVEMADRRKSHYEKYGPPRYINTPTYKIPLDAWDDQS